DAPNDWSLVAKFTDDSVVTFGYDDLEGQMSRLTQVMDVTTAKNFRLATVNLLPRKNVPVTFRGEAGPLTSSSSISTGVTAVPSSTPSRPLPAVKPPPREVGRQLEEILGGGR